MTILEITLSLGIGAIVIICLTGFLLLGMRAWGVGGTQGTVDRDASYAVRRVIRDVREGAQLHLVTNDHALIYFRERDVDGSYIDGTLDGVNYVEFYRGDEEGIADPNGSCLWRAVGGVPESAIARDVSAVNFDSPDPDTLRVTLSLAKRNTFGEFACSHTWRVIKLRNW